MLLPIQGALLSGWPTHNTSFGSNDSSGCKRQLCIGARRGWMAHACPRFARNGAHQVGDGRHRLCRGHVDSSLSAVTQRPNSNDETRPGGLRWLRSGSGRVNRLLAGAERADQPRHLEEALRASRRRARGLASCALSSRQATARVQMVLECTDELSVWYNPLRPANRGYCRNCRGPGM